MAEGILRQFMVAFFGSISVFCAGCCFAWLSPLIERLTSENSEMPMSMGEVSIVLSMLDVGSLISPIPVGFFVDHAGRKPVLLMAGPLFISSWILVFFFRSVNVLYIVRIIQGFSIGLVFSTLPMYLGEVAGSNVRGRMGLFVQGMTSLGMVFEFSIGPFIDLAKISWISVIPPLVFVGGFVWFPESPYYLMMRGREEKAGESLVWFRGGSRECGSELWEIRRAVEEERRTKASWKDVLGRSEGRKSLLIMEVVLMTYTMGGAVTTLNYASTLFSEATGGSGASNLYPIGLIGLILILFPIPIFLIERVGRRPLVLTAALLASIAHLITAVFFLLKAHTSLNFSSYTWVPCLSLISATVLLVCGVESVKHVLQAELFPNSTRGIAAGIVILSERLMSILNLMIFPVINDRFGLMVNFFVFAFFSFASFLLMYRFLPETKGKTLMEIQGISK